ncbi:MAG: tetratricopeptide repeat protein [Candidatus Euphemobacter frigidus]|nr:tetratricopeptide repeat protein [Candidatus Euphemobacter frigidus]MDP8275342.1 tetratricopeptide repeat protein [Candidatus Euphemobacter frigidus]
MNNVPKRRLSRHLLILAAILFVGLLLRLIYLGEIRDTPDFEHPGLDAAYHIYWARGMATGDWAAFQGREDPQIYRYPYYRPPGYAFFLALIYRACGLGSLAPRLFQIGLGLLSALLAYHLARRWFGVTTGLIAAAALSIYWIFIYYEGELVGVSLSVFLSLFFISILDHVVSRRSFPGGLAAGLVLGVLVLARPNALLLYPGVVAWVVWVGRRRGEKGRVLVVAGSLLLGVLIAALPVTVRNYVVSREFVPLATNAGISLGVANNELSDGTTHHIPGIGNVGTPYDWPRIVRGLSERLGRRLSHSEASAYLSRQAFQFIRRRPGRFLRLLGRKALLFWGPREVRNLKEVHYARLHSPLLRRLPGNFALAASLGGLGLLLLFSSVVKRGGEGRELEGGVLIVIFIALYFISMLPFAAAARYRVPVIPFLLIPAAYGVKTVVVFWVHRQWVRAAAWTVSGVVLYLLFSINFSGFQPTPAKWHQDRGLARLEAEQWEDAASEFRLALKSSPDYAAYTNLGIACQRGGELDQAVMSYRQALHLAPDSPRALKNLADAELARGEIEEAVALYRRALEVNPEYTGIACDLARILAEAGRDQEANDLYQDILRNCPDDARAHLGLGNLLLDQGHPARAREHYRAALRGNPHSIRALYNLANVLIREGRIEEGVAAYREVLRREPTHLDANNNLGVQLAREGKIEEAMAHLQAALRIDPADPAAYFNIAVTLTGVGRRDEAIPYLEKVLELRPDYEPARKILAAFGKESGKGQGRQGEPRD